MGIFILLTILFFLSSAVVVFDSRLNKAKKAGLIPPDEPTLPSWVVFIYWVWIGLGITLLIINWQNAILVFIGYFILSFLPILEIVGNIIMRPFKPKTKSSRG